jgi:hypothetical protein
MRKKIKTFEKHLPIKLVDTDEPSRIKKAVAAEGNASLRESFNLRLFEEPKWKKIEKTKWLSPNGMSYSGQMGAHVANARSRLMGPSQRVEMAYLSQS